MYVQENVLVEGAGYRGEEGQLQDSVGRTWGTKAKGGPGWGTEEVGPSTALKDGVGGYLGK